MDSTKIDSVDIQANETTFCDEVAAVPGGEHIRMCFSCGTCAAGCPVTEVEKDYNPRKIIRQIHLGMKKEVLSSPLIWLCMMCYRCYSRCPQQVNFTDIMGALRFLAIKEGYAPKTTVKQNDEIEMLAQALRQKMIRESDQEKIKLMEEIKAKIG
ncbi:MAG: 4Fe-4S dicluster domain-containing protein [Spirochaetales bacterium]|nr:4Fe-4S dicluster domain-containing protein [Spirochaetales bacterium]